MRVFSLILVAAFSISIGCDQDSETTDLSPLGNQSKSGIHPQNVQTENSNAEILPAKIAEPSDQLVAQEVLDSAIAQAKTDDKKLLVHFSADW